MWPAVVIYVVPVVEAVIIVGAVIADHTATKPARHANRQGEPW